MSQFRVSNIDKRNYIATYEFYVELGRSGNHVIILILYIKFSFKSCKKAPLWRWDIMLFLNPL